MSTFLIALLAITIYLLIILFLQRKKLLEKYHLALSGPVLMWRTERGKKFIDRIAKRKFWKHFGSLGLGLALFLMFAMFLLLIWSATIATKIPPERAPSPQMLIGLPGINPIIPVGYGIVGLVITLVVHEFSHGILARAAKVKIKSLGLLFFIIPLGAFVEPDEEELKKVEKIKRCRVFASGPFANFVTGLVCALIFSWVFMSALSPVAQGVFVTGVVKNSPAESSIHLGAVITNFNNTEIRSLEIFQNETAKTKACQIVNITFYYKGSFVTKNVTLANRANYTDNEEDNGTGYLGISYADAKVFPKVLSRPFAETKSLTDFIGSSFFYIALPIMGLAPLAEPYIDIYAVQGPLSFLPTWLFWSLANIFYWIFWINVMLGLTNVLPAVPFDGGYIFKDVIDSVVKKRKYAVPAFLTLFSTAFVACSAENLILSQIPSRLAILGLLLWSIAICAMSLILVAEQRFILKVEHDDSVKESLIKAISYSVALFILFLILWQFIGPWLRGFLS